MDNEKKWKVTEFEIPQPIQGLTREDIICTIDGKRTELTEWTEVEPGIYQYNYKITKEIEGL